MTGALEAVAELTVDYANERQQFGKPVATFQAVAQHLVRLVSETQLAVMALHTAVAASSKVGIEGAGWEVAAFKAVAGESADEVTARAHQVHGAIGMTQEYRLHQLTRRLWAWRQEFGSTAAWRCEVGTTLAAAGADRAWPLIVAGTAAG
jgi:acyl-CoA dehydrogenase